MAGNTSPNGLAAGLAVATATATLEMTRCTVRDNRAPDSGVGGGIYTAGSTTLTDCLVEANSASGGGGGLRVVGG